MKYDILLIGGNGFVGRVIAAQLQLAGYSVLVPTGHLGARKQDVHRSDQARYTEATPGFALAA